MPVVQATQEAEDHGGARPAKAKSTRPYLKKKKKKKPKAEKAGGIA
jgi:hypothetical protein